MAGGATAPSFRPPPPTSRGFPSGVIGGAAIFSPTWPSATSPIASLTGPASGASAAPIAEAAAATFGFLAPAPNFMAKPLEDVSPSPGMF